MDEAALEYPCPVCNAQPGYYCSPQFGHVFIDKRFIHSTRLPEPHDSGGDRG